MVIGEAGTRKSSAIKIAKRLINNAGYDNVGADKTTKEKFLLDLEGVTIDEGRVGEAREYDLTTAQNLWDGSELVEPREVFIMADEWNDFAGTGNVDFYTTLGNLWDWDDEDKPYTSRVKNSRSVSIYQPTISILGGNTQENFARAFPPEAIGIGFLSRMILIHAELSGRKYTFPPSPSEEGTKFIIKSMRGIRNGTYTSGEEGKHRARAANVTGTANSLFDKLYHTWQPIEDVRFKNYSNRRLTHLFKICLVIAASRGTSTISEDIVITANTYLSAAEHDMPKALGEFGKSKYSDVANKIMDILNAARRPMTAKDIWSHIHSDLDKMIILQEIMNGLMMAGKVQLVANKGWLPKKQVPKSIEFVDWSILTEEERKWVV